MPNRLLVALYLASAAVQPALAADLPQHTVTMPSESPRLFTWTGFHVGVNAGYMIKQDRLA